MRSRLPFLLLLACLFGCSPTPDTQTTVPLSTPVVYSNEEVFQFFPGCFTGDVSYAQVNSAWLPVFYKEFQADLFRKKVKYDTRFDCNHFAGYYVELAQISFYADNFHSSTPAQTLAVGVYWYSPNGPKQPGHAVVVALTERGTVFIEPQTGQEVKLSDAYKASSTLKAF